MSITIDEIVQTHNSNLKTITSKIIYLIIKNGEKDDEGYHRISINQLMQQTGVSRRHAVRIIAGMLAVGLIEKRTDKQRPTETNSYRIIDY